MSAVLGLSGGVRRRQRRKEQGALARALGANEGERRGGGFLPRGFSPGEPWVAQGQSGGPTDGAPRHLLAGVLLRAKAARWTRGAVAGGDGFTGSPQTGPAEGPSPGGLLRGTGALSQGTQWGRTAASEHVLFHEHVCKLKNTMAHGGRRSAMTGPDMTSHKAGFREHVILTRATSPVLWGH